MSQTLWGLGIDSGKTMHKNVRFLLAATIMASMPSVAFAGMIAAPAIPDKGIRTTIDPSGIDPTLTGILPASTFVLSPTVFGNQPHANSRVVKSFEGLGDYDLRRLGVGVTPPDTMGAVGTTQFVQIINGGFGVFDKQTGALTGAMRDSSFWSQLGQTGTGGDPRILFNAQQNRWIALGFGANLKDINLAVSDTANALGGWKATRFEGFAPLGAGFRTIADYPTLAMDNNAIYISTNNFAASTAGASAATPFRGTSLFVLPTADVFQASGPSAGNIKAFNTPFSNDVSTDRGFAIQGVNSNEAANGIGHVVARSLHYFASVAYDINDAGTAGATQGPLEYLTSDYGPGGAARQPGRPDATTLGPLRNIDPLDFRVASNAWEVNGKTYFTQTITRTGRDFTTVRITVIDSDTKEVLQSFNIEQDGYDFYQGSIGISSHGRAVVAYNRSGTDPTDGKIGIYAQTFVVGADGLLVPRMDPILIKTSLTAGYLNGNAEKTGAPAGRQRWGDYAAVTVDPNNPKLFWLIGQYASQAYEVARPGYPAVPSGFSRWGQYIAAVNGNVVPEPATWMQLIAGFAIVGAAARRRGSRLRVLSA